MRTNSIFVVIAATWAMVAAGTGCDGESNPVLDGAAADLAPADAGVEVSVDLPAPDLTAPDGPQPDAAQPDMAQPDMLQPDMLQPDMMQPDLVPPPLSVSITYPPRAAMLGSATVTVKGKVVGTLSYLSSLKVNGQSVTPNASGEFTHVMSSKWGMNLITVDTVDKSNRKNHLAQTYHYSTKYWPINTASPKGMAVTSAAVGRLYQKAIDDGNRSTVNDLATILVKVINSLNWDKLVPSTLVSGKYKIPPWGPTISYKVTKTGKFKVNPFSLSVKARTGGVAVSGSTSYLELPFKATAGISVSGKLKVYNLSLKSDINISKKSGGAVSVSVPYIKMNYSSLKVDLGGGLLGAIASSITNGVASLFKGQIIKAMEGEVKKALPGPVKSFVTGFKLATSFTLPSSIGGQGIGIYSDLDVIAFDTGGGTLKLNAAVYGKKKAVADAKKGTLGVGSSYTPASTSSKAMEVGLRYDALNQVFGAAWYAGVLKQDVSSLLLSGIDMSKIPFKIKSMKFGIDGLLPPVLQPPSKTGWDFDVTIGDLAIKVDIVMPAAGGASGGTLTLEGYVAGVMGGKITINSKNELVLQLDNKFSVFEIEVTKMAFAGSNAPTLGDVALGIRSLVTQLMPKVLSPILQKFPIPTIDLSSLGGQYGIPKGTVLKLKNTSLKLKSYHVLLSGDLG